MSMQTSCVASRRSGIGIDDRATTRAPLSLRLFAALAISAAPALSAAQVTGKTTVRLRLAPDGHVVDVHLLRPAGLTREHDLLDADADTLAKANVAATRWRTDVVRALPQ